VTLPVIVVRPEPGCAASVATGTALGLDIHGFPLFAVRPRPWVAPQGPFDGLLIGSANVFRHAGPALADLRRLPVHAVGEVTAEAAGSAGFAVASIGAGGLQAVLDTMAPPARLLRLAGADHVALIPPSGITLETRIVYASEPRPMPAALVDQLAADAVVLLHSAGAARHFAAECDRVGVARAGVRLVTLGPRIAAAAGAGWPACHTASVPTEAALLALAADLCHVSPGREGP
jgi:uroporphyrinogen-III synthase